MALPKTARTALIGEALILYISSIVDLILTIDIVYTTLLLPSNHRLTPVAPLV